MAPWRVLHTVDLTERWSGMMPESLPDVVFADGVPQSAVAVSQIAASSPAAPAGIRAEPVDSWCLLQATSPTCSP